MMRCLRQLLSPRPSKLPLLSATLFVSATLIVPPLAAQPEKEVTQLLFEPVLLVDGKPAVEHTLVSFNDAQAAIPVPVLEQAPYTPEQRAQMEQDIANYLKVIGDGEADQGPFADQLREDLFSTGVLYQKLDDHENALKLFERTLHVSRINHGLDDIDQVNVLEAMALSYRALEKLKDADAMMDSAFHIQELRYGPHTQEMVAAERRLGDWNTQAFMERSSILVNIPRMNVQRFVTDPRNYIDPGVDLRDTPLFKLYQARTNYLDALKTLVDARNFTHPELMELERKLLTNFFLSTHRENILYEPDFYLTRKKSKTSSRLNQNSIELMNSDDYDLGQESHKRRMAYLVSDENRTPQQLVNAMLEEADWDLLFERKTNAYDKYIAAYAFFNANPQIIEGAHDQLYPALPQVLPTYLPAPNSREKLGIPADANVNYFGYIDVSFSLTKFGKARRITQMGKSGEITKNMEIRLAEYLRRVLFRPRFKGTDVDTGTVTLRYYVGV